MADQFDNQEVPQGGNGDNRGAVDKARDRVSGVKNAADNVKNAAQNIKKLANGIRKAASAIKNIGTLVGAAASSEIIIPIILIVIGVFIIIMILIFIFGAINGSGGKTSAVPSAANDAGVKKVLELEQEKAQVGGQTIGKYTKVAFSERDKTFLNNSLTKGYDGDAKISVDRRLVEAIEYLASKHSRIYVSHIVNVYEKMPIDTENSGDPQIIANISAHKSGQAGDIREIDFVFLGMDPMSKCGKDPRDPRRDLVWLNDRSQELLRQKCKGNIFQPKTGGPIIRGISTKPFPIKIAWQDDPPSVNKSAQGRIRSAGERLVERALKLPAGSLDTTGDKSRDILENIGMAEMAGRLQLDSDQLFGDNPEQVYLKIGRTVLEDKLKLSRDALKGTTKDGVVINAGGAVLKDIWQLPKSEWDGTTLPLIAQSVGRATFEQEMGAGEGTFKNSASSKSFFDNTRTNKEDMTALAQTYRLSTDDVQRYFESLRSGNPDNSVLITVGKKRLERTWGLPEGTLDNYMNPGGISQPEDLVNKLPEGWKEWEMKPNYVLPPDSLANLLTSLGKGEDVRSQLEEIGKSQIRQAMGVWDGSLGVARGPAEEGEEADGTSEDPTIKQARESLLGSGKFSEYVGKYGQQVFDERLGWDLPYQQTLPLSKEQLEAFRKNPKAAAKEVGKLVLKNNLGISEDQLNTILKGGDWRVMSMNLDLLQKKFLMSQTASQSAQKGDWSQATPVWDTFKKKYNLTDDDIQKIQRGDWGNISFVRETIKSELKIPEDYWNGLNWSQKRDLGGTRDISLSDGDVNTKIAEGEWKDMPEVEAVLKARMGLPDTDWAIIKNGGSWRDLSMTHGLLKDSFGLQDGEISSVLSGDLTGIPILSDLDASLGLSKGTFAGLLSGQGNIKDVLGAGLGVGFSLPGIGGGADDVMKKVYRPEARYKTHQALEELLAMPRDLKDINMRVTQLITFSFKRDVESFKAQLDDLYGKGRLDNYGLFAMPEAHPNIHIGY